MLSTPTAVSTKAITTEVAIIGAGSAGCLIANLLDKDGIDCNNPPSSEYVYDNYIGLSMREYITDRCCALSGGDIVTSEDSVVEQLLEHGHILMLVVIQQQQLKR